MLSVSSKTKRPAFHDMKAFHAMKGRIKRFLGWMTADRRVEAEGEAEARTGHKPSEATVEAVEHQVKRGYGETLDQPPRG